MNILLNLYIVFFKIGLFGFGGGYAMIGMIQSQITSLSWIDETEFIRMIAVAEMTPGPISINLATYVGYKMAGLLGALVATMGVATPSLLILIFISNLLFKYYEHPLTTLIFQYIKPVIAGLILTAALKISYNAFLNAQTASNNDTFALSNINFISVFTFCLILFLEYGTKKKIHPILYLLISGVIGYVSGIFPMF